MSAEIEQPPLRECSACGKPKPLTDAFFESRDNGVELVYRRQCKACRRAGSKAADKALAKERRRCSSCCLKLGLQAFVGESNKCKLCDGLNGCNPTRKRHRSPPGLDPKYIPGPKPCVACHDMPWRVAGPRCPCCQLNYAPEPRPEFVLRRFDRCG